MKRLVDIFFSFLGLLMAAPVLLVFMFLVYRQDKQTPFYVAPRVGKGGAHFKMIKLRSMSVNADKTGVDSTSADDLRITPIGHIIRKYKVDEIAQLFNVLTGDMSLVGPRPNVKKGGTDLYTSVEERILTVRPGITDFSSIIFSDEGNILLGSGDPDLAYNQLIRPWKSRLALIYIDNQTPFLDIQIIFYTAVAIVAKKKAIDWVGVKLKELNVDPEIIDVVRRDTALVPSPPPGATDVVSSV